MKKKEKKGMRWGWFWFMAWILSQLSDYSFVESVINYFSKPL